MAKKSAAARKVTPKAPNNKIIITCAVTGASMTPSMSPYLPCSPEDIAAQSIEAAKAGAAMIHLHARDLKDGRPTNDPKVWQQFVPKIKKGCDAIVNMSASLGATAEDRVEAVRVCKPEVATVIVGSMNYGNFKKATDQGLMNFKYEWERESFGPKSYHVVTNNTFDKIDKMMGYLIEMDIAMEFEAYDIGHLYILEHHLKKHAKKMRRPIILQFLTGILGGITSEIDHLLHLKRTSERLFGSELALFTHGTGPVNIKTAAQGAIMGTNVRVGMEDNLIDEPGVLFKSNKAQVDKIVRILDELHIPIATASEARKMLGLDPRK